MAIFSLRAKTFSRRAGQSAVALAAYRSAEKLTDERTHQIKDYTAGAGRIVFSQIMLPADASERYRSRQFLWNEVERFERRSDARLAREIMVALPHELTDQQREWLVREFVRENLTRRSYAADVNIHAPSKGDPRNFHCHILFTDRQLGASGFKETKDRALNSKEQLEHWRERWAALTNRYLERFGHAARVDHRSLVAQGIDREPTIHLGPAATEMVARGADTDRGDIQAGIVARNALAASVTTDAAILAKLQQRAANENGLQVAIRDQDVAGVIALLTQRRPTFGSRDLGRFLARSITEPTARLDFEAAVLAHPSIVPLAATPNGRVTRYTTRAILTAENQVLRTADKMARSGRHRLPWIAVKEVVDQPQFAGIDAEQLAALEHLVRADALSILIGRAGTGKSFTLNALRQAYEREGFAVVGLSFTNKVAQNLSRDGFRQATTVHSELRALDLGRRSWTANTLVVVDEAAMLSTELMGKVIEKAEAAGAKLVLAGDNRQLPSIDKGGILPVLVDRYGAASLTTVRRQREAEERRASELLGAGKIKEALAIFDQRQAIRWSDTQAAAAAALVADWITDRTAHPDASRIVLAYTNSDVDRLNAALRGAARDLDAENGRVTAETWLNTSRGSEPYAAGDRLQLTGNDRQRDLFNGQFGTVLGVTPEQMTVRLDDRPDAPVSFDPREYPHIRHGFASTIHTVQGETIDRLQVYHSQHWRAASGYVALTRHREAVSMYVARETAADLDQLSGLLSRSENQRAASTYHEVTLLPVRPLTPRQARIEATGYPVTANDRDQGWTLNDRNQAVMPTEGQGGGRRTEAPATGRRDGAREAGPAAGTTQTIKPRYRARADGTIELVSGPAVPPAGQDAPGVPVPPPRLPESGRVAATAPAVPTGQEAQRAAERRGLQRGDLLRVRQVHRSTKDQVSAFLKLAKDPAANLGEWLDLGPPVPGAPQVRPAAQLDQAADQQPAQGIARSAVAGWSEAAGRVQQEASANVAVSRVRALSRPKSPRTTRELVDRDMALARHPASDLPAWLGLDPPNPAFLPQPTKEPRHGPQTSDRAAGIGEPVRADALPGVRLRVDADRGGGLDVVRLSGGPDAGPGRPQDVQPVRGGGGDRPGELTPPTVVALPPAPAFQPLPGLSAAVSITYGAAGFTPLPPAAAPTQTAVQPAAAPDGPITPAAPEAPQVVSVASATAVPVVDPPAPAAPFAPIVLPDSRDSQVRHPADQPAAASAEVGAAAFVAPLPDALQPAPPPPPAPEQVAMRLTSEPPFQRAGNAATQPRPAAEARDGQADQKQPVVPMVRTPGGRLRPMDEIERFIWEARQRSDDSTHRGDGNAHSQTSGRTDTDRSQSTVNGPRLSQGGRAPPR